jgi:hexosaminidase
VSAQLPAVVPAPLRMDAAPGRAAVLRSPLAISAPAAVEGEARWFRRAIEAGTGWDVDVVPAGEPAAIVLGTDDALASAGQPPGAYRLTATDGAVRVIGDSPAGVFYGLQTLRQMLPARTLRRAPAWDPSGPLTVGPIQVEDRPRFPWRGVHLDVSRHFMPKRFVLDLIDAIAFHKCNIFHFHLTDDQGWRVPIDRYPRLVEVGAWRQESPLGHKRELRFDGVPHGGAYTKEDLREIVAFATERHITIVPEVDMPGHMAAAIAAYPELGRGRRNPAVWTHWGVCTQVLNLEEPTIRFCTDVIDEVLDLFPGPYFHMGGDECPTTEWSRSARGRQLMADEGYSRPRQLQSWFTRRVADHVAARGRTLVGWDEVLEEGAPPGTVVMAWRSLHAALDAVAAGHDVVLAPERPLYFDWAYSHDDTEPLAIRGANSVKDVYRFDPVVPALTDGQRHLVLGAQCQLWTEYVPTPQRAEFQYFPRLCAFAETVWTQKTATPPRSYAEFLPRLRRHLQRLEVLGVSYRPLDGPARAPDA